MKRAQKKEKAWSVLTDASGAIVEEEEYEEFGSGINGITERYKFTGKEQDATGLYYFGARYYDPLIGRFITTDPVKGDQMNPQTFNPYVYCLNNPLKYVDPDGRDSMIHPDYNWPDETVSEGHWWGGLIMVGSLAALPFAVGYGVPAAAPHVSHAAKAAPALAKGALDKVGSSIQKGAKDVYGSAKEKAVEVVRNPIESFQSGLERIIYLDKEGFAETAASEGAKGANWLLNKMKNHKNSQEEKEYPTWTTPIDSGSSSSDSDLPDHWDRLKRKIF